MILKKSRMYTKLFKKIIFLMILKYGVIMNWRPRSSFLTFLSSVTTVASSWLPAPTVLEILRVAYLPHSKPSRGQSYPFSRAGVQKHLQQATEFLQSNYECKSGGGRKK